MTTPSEPAGVAAIVGGRRLHPWSWLFVLLQQLRQFALPLLVLLFTGRGNQYELWGLAGAGVLVLVSLGQYFTYRYRIDGDGLVIRSGLLQRSLRHIPFDRIQNVALHQSLLHRVFGVAEVRLESGAGQKPEGQMRVLSLADAQALEARVRGHGATRAGLPAAEASVATPLLALDTAEVIRLGLISNRGMVLLAAGIGGLASAGDNLLGAVIEASQVKTLVKAALGWGESQHIGILGAVLAGLLLFAAAVAALRLLSVLLALLQFHGFTLSEQGRRLQVRRGLLTRLHGSLPRRRIQAWSLAEGLLHRLFRRQGLRVDSASVDAVNEERSLRDLAPLATPAAMAALIRHLLPGVTWPIEAWRPLHPRAWRRQFTLPALLATLACAAATWRLGPTAAWGLLLLPMLLLRARIWARHAGYAEADGLVAVREGWLSRHWRFAEVEKLQALRLTQSPFDRRHGMASLWLDTAGASPMAPPLRIRYLPEAEARALMAGLAARMATLTPARTAESAAPGS